MNWQLITFLGDSTLLLPSALLVFGILLFSARNRRLAWLWALLFGCTGLVVCASKLAFMGWGIGSRTLDFTGISGHTALSSVFWPVLLWLLSSRYSPAVRLMASGAGFAIAAVIGFSRLIVHAHSPMEVISGLLLGMTVSVVFLVLQRRFTVVSLSYGKMASVLILPLVLLNTGAKAPTQSLLGSVAAALGQLERPYTRADLHAGITPPPAQ